MNKIDAWLLTEGAHGMISQVEGLAKALNANYQHKKIIYNSFWNFFPPALSPKKSIVFNFEEIINEKTEIQRPALLISCGRKSVIPSIVLKSFLEKKIIKKFLIFTYKIQKFPLLTLILLLPQNTIP